MSKGSLNVRSDLLHSIWDPVTVFHEYLEGNPIMEKTITIGEVKTFFKDNSFSLSNCDLFSI